jgi:hypothetical protein
MGKKVEPMAANALMVVWNSSARPTLLGPKMERNFVACSAGGRICTRFSAPAVSTVDCETKKQ